MRDQRDGDRFITYFAEMTDPEHIKAAQRVLSYCEMICFFRLPPPVRCGRMPPPGNLVQTKKPSSGTRRQVGPWSINPAPGRT